MTSATAANMSKTPAAMEPPVLLMFSIPAAEVVGLWSSAVTGTRVLVGLLLLVLIGVLVVFVVTRLVIPPLLSDKEHHRGISSRVGPDLT